MGRFWGKCNFNSLDVENCFCDRFILMSCAQVTPLETKFIFICLFVHAKQKNNNYCNLYCIWMDFACGLQNPQPYTRIFTSFIVIYLVFTLLSYWWHWDLLATVLYCTSKQRSVVNRISSALYNFCTPVWHALHKILDILLAEILPFLFQILEQLFFVVAFPFLKLPINLGP